MELTTVGSPPLLKIALVGLGKMGISHQAIVNSHPNLDLRAICDPTDYLREAVSRYTGIKGYADFNQLLRSEVLDAVVIATPSRFHPEMVQAALEAGLHVFCEKPFCLDPADSAALATLAADSGLVTQVGYHYRFVEPFRQLRQILERKELGELHHIRAEAYGPVVLHPKGSTWRSAKIEGGGCLYDYASHAIDLVNFLVGPPLSVGGSTINRVFSRDVDDEVYSTLFFPNGMTGQIAANWSDESFRKMSMKISVWGTAGRAVADRQELQVYRRGEAAPGWDIRYAPEMTEDVWYYLRGEEYSQQIDHFVQSILSREQAAVSNFESAFVTDQVIGAILRDSQSTSSTKITSLHRHEEVTNRAPLLSRILDNAKQILRMGR